MVTRPSAKWDNLVLKTGVAPFNGDPGNLAPVQGREIPGRWGLSGPITRSAKAMSRLYRWSDLPRLAGLALLYMLLAN